MTLAELIHKALKDPKFRLALETGSLTLPGSNLSPVELQAAALVLRHDKSKQGKGVIAEIYAAWRE